MNLHASVTTITRIKSSAIRIIVRSRLKLSRCNIFFAEKKQQNNNNK